MPLRVFRLRPRTNVNQRALPRTDSQVLQRRARDNAGFDKCAGHEEALATSIRCGGSTLSRLATGHPETIKTQRTIIGGLAWSAPPSGRGEERVPCGCSRCVIKLANC